MYDFAIVGGGIVGLSTGMALSERYPHARILVLEKEKDWAFHQSGHNSGVIHSGIYYPPGSLKARLAREGNRSMVAFCRSNGIPYEVCGKVIVATKEEELPLLEKLFQRGKANQLDIQMIGKERLKEIEPHVNGLAAIYVPTAGIVDYRQVCRAFRKKIHGDLLLNTKVERVREEKDSVHIETASRTFHARFLINCAGLHSDRVAKRSGVDVDLKIVPFRGEFYKLRPEKEKLVNHLVYPVPNPHFPFLGVHLTRLIGGGVKAGPNAVLSLKREGYDKTDFSLMDTAEVLTYPGFWRLAVRYWKEGLAEMVRSFSKKAFVRSLQQLVPDIDEDDLEPAPAGVRAQALKPDGTLVDDFHLIQGKNSIHVCNAPSPAATASIEIGKEIVSRISRIVEPGKLSRIS